MEPASIGIEIRTATEYDLPVLLALDSECFPLGCPDLEPAPPGEIATGVKDETMFVATTSQKVVGMLQLDKVSSNEWELLSLAITATHRGQGIGQALMVRFFVELSKSPYLVAVSCLTSPNNHAMQGLLERVGFRQVAMIPDCFGPGKHRLKFQLN
jgi:ribosomal protein S18 acetylase RimI-like enzyme